MFEILFNKAADPQACNFIKKKPQRRCFPVKFAKFLKTAFLIKHLRRLLLCCSKESFESWYSVILCFRYNEISLECLLFLVNHPHTLAPLTENKFFLLFTSNSYSVALAIHLLRSHLWKNIAINNHFLNFVFYLWLFLSLFDLLTSDENMQMS